VLYYTIYSHLARGYRRGFLVLEPGSVVVPTAPATAQRT
jgi:hypothetical protein